MVTDAQSPPRRKLRLVRIGREWWLDAAHVSPDEPLWGPYTKAEAIEARDSWHRNAIDLFPPRRVVTDRRRK